MSQKRIILAAIAITTIVVIAGGIYLAISYKNPQSPAETVYSDPDLQDITSVNGKRLQEITLPNGKKTKVRAEVLMVRITDPNTVKTLGGRATPFPGIPQVYEVKVPVGKDLMQAKAELEKMPGVAYAEPDYINFAQALPRIIPNDTHIANQASLNDISAPEAWALNTGSSGTTIAIIDSGAWGTHPDLVNKYSINAADPVDGVDNDGNGYVDDNFGMDFVRGTIRDANGDGTVEWVNDANGADDDNHGGLNGDGHGTAVAGAAAAQSNNGAGVASVNWNARILPIAVGSDGGGDITYFESHVAAGIYYSIARGAQVISLSIGRLCAAETTCPSELMRQSMQAAQASNVVTVAATGNNSTSNEIHNIARIATIAVAAIDTGTLTKASYSNSGPEVDIGAPVPVVTTQKGGGYVPMAGTSLATPQVAAAAAYVLGLNPGLSPAQVLNVLQATANAPPGGRNNDVGAGRINLYKLIRFCQTCI
ncbi:MAG TPA: S8 family serine peptidase [Candidatus Saccharimonadia bacterium]